MDQHSPGSGLTLSVTVMGDFPLPKGLTKTSLHSLCLWALEAEEASGDWEIGIMLISDEVIQDMHRDFMGVDSPTDIMTFPYQPPWFDTRAPVVSGGDFVISMETASANAVTAGWKLRDELEFLVLHGVLHILGWDDADPEARGAMLSRQTRILEEWRNRSRT